MRSVPWSHNLALPPARTGLRVTGPNAKFFGRSSTPWDPPTYQDEQQWRGTGSSVTDNCFGGANFKPIEPRGWQEGGHPVTMLHLPCSPRNASAWKILCWNISYRAEGRLWLWALRSLPQRGAPSGRKPTSAKLVQLLQDWLCLQPHKP